MLTNDKEINIIKLLENKNNLSSEAKRYLRKLKLRKVRISI